MADIERIRLSLEDTLLLVVDVQERLMAAMEESVRDRTVGRILIMIEAAKRLNFPVLVTEQYPKGLGKTVDAIAGTLTEFSPYAKMTFSCCGAEGFLPHLRRLDRRKVLLTGAETHVCCYQTALDLLENGYIVHAVADALCSRSKLNWEKGLATMEHAGVIPSTTEQAVFDLLRIAGTEDFKALAKMIK